ncbi:MAG: cupin domain-containing protein [Ignavibacteriae bacterium]|nr:cupin domain-containing protein [Ignavibacteriota bacterium]
MTSFFILILTFFLSSNTSQQDKPSGYVLERESEIGKQQPGPHDGDGTTTGYSFFADVKDLKFVFRKRALHPGSSIGYHKQEWDEVYYILSGTGEMAMNGTTFPVKAGDAILTRPGSSHGLKQTGKDDLVIFISYQLD